MISIESQPAMVLTGMGFETLELSLKQMDRLLASLSSEEKVEPVSVPETLKGSLSKSNFLLLGRLAENFLH